MTTLTIALTKLPEKGADIDVLRQMVQFMAQRLVEIDVEARRSASYDEKASAARLSGSNGYRDRSWDTHAGSIELKIPRLRRGSYCPSSWSRGARPRRRWPRSSRRPTCKASPPA